MHPSVSYNCENIGEMGFRCNAHSLIAPPVPVRGDPRCIFRRYPTTSHLTVSFPVFSSPPLPPPSLASRLTISAIKCILPPINSRDRALLRLNRLRPEENCPVAPWPCTRVTYTALVALCDDAEGVAVSHAGRRESLVKTYAE